MSISIISLFVSVVALLVSFLMSSRQNQISLKQYTLSYIDMENNDELLIESRKWLLNIYHTIDYIDSFCSSKSFLEYKGICIDNLKENEFPDDARDLIDEFIMGNNYINKIIMARVIASEAIVSKLIDEETYWLVRHVDFFRDYSKLDSFILKKYKQKNCDESYSRKAFRMIVNKWRDEEVIDVKNKMKKRKWRKHWKNLQ